MGFLGRSTTNHMSSCCEESRYISCCGCGGRWDSGAAGAGAGGKGSREGALCQAGLAATGCGGGRYGSGDTGGALGLNPGSGGALCHTGGEDDAAVGGGWKGSGVSGGALGLKPSSGDALCHTGDEDGAAVGGGWKGSGGNGGAPALKPSSGGTLCHTGGGLLSAGGELLKPPIRVLSSLRKLSSIRFRTNSFGNRPSSNLAPRSEV